MEKKSDIISCPHCGPGAKLRDMGRQQVQEGNKTVVKQRIQCLGCNKSFLSEKKASTQLLG